MVVPAVVSLLIKRVPGTLVLGSLGLRLGLLGYVMVLNCEGRIHHYVYCKAGLKLAVLSWAY